MALHLLLLTLVRTTEMLEARWAEFDLEAALWRIPAERMKMREPHTVPLSRQALELLKKLYAVTGNGEYLFPNRSNLRRPVSRGVLWKAIASMGYAGQLLAARHSGDRINDSQRDGLPPGCDRTPACAPRTRSVPRRAYDQAEYLEGVEP